MRPATAAPGGRPSRVVFLSGPTATGKTELVLQLARRLPVDIISADAAQVYRGMDIGTAKPDPATLARFPHRLIDIRDPWQSYSAADFRVDALQEVERSLAAGRIPLVTGGTMFYLSALINGLSEMPHADDRVREAILERAAREGWQVLHDELAGIDPELAASIQPGDRQRLQRAHEIFRMTNRPPSRVWKASRPAPIPHRFVNLAVFLPQRQELHRRIEIRFRSMLEQGLLEEVRRLRQEPRLTADSVAMRTVGYRQTWEYLDGLIGFEELVASAVAATRQLAKRQLTWMRGTRGLVWFDASTPATFDSLLRYLEACRIQG